VPVTRPGCQCSGADSALDSEVQATRTVTLPHTLKVKDHKEWILGVLPICHQVATQITRCIDRSVHTTAQSMQMTGDQLRAVFSQPLATAGGLPLHVPAPVSSDSEEED